MSGEKDTRSNTPLILSLGHIIGGLVLIVAVVLIILLAPPQNFGDIIAIISFVFLFGGFGVLMIIVGYKRGKC